MQSATRLIGVTALLLGGFELWAHHPFTSEFDSSKAMTLTGTISKVEWVKPHAYIYLDVKNEAGRTEQWKLETASPDYLKEHGMASSTFKKGEQLTVHAYGATKEDHVASARMVTANGKDMEVADPHEDGGPAK